MHWAVGRNRRVVLFTVGVVVIWWYLLDCCKGPDAVDELRSLMNGGKPAFPIEVVESSFDWNSISFRYPPEELTPVPTGKVAPVPAIQFKSRRESSADATLRKRRQQEVKKAFEGDWEAYRRYAWMSDALLPISGGSRHQFSGWSATLVDSLDTLWIMGLRKEFDEAVAAVAKIDFGKSSSSRVNTFETNIRYLGGLIAAYDLSKRDVLLTKAIELGDMMYAAFNTENRMPVDFIDFERAKTGEGLQVEYSVVSASPGTLSLELTRLSQLTGDPKYYDAISAITDLFYRGQDHTQLPGLWPMMVSMRTQNVVSGNQFTLGGCADSLYEYLPKMHALLGGREPKYQTMAKGFLEAAKNTILFKPMLPRNESILIAGSGWVDENGNFVQSEETEHLACYLGGIYGIAGKMFKNPEYVDIGAKLTLGCGYAYRSFTTGMAPERWNMVACDRDEECLWDPNRFDEEKQKRAEWKPHLPLGFTTAKDPRYILRPEAIESVFVMYRITGDPIFMDLGWDMFSAIANGTKTNLGTHASVQDVTKALPVLPKEDYMESFWLGETLKYFYLLFSSPDIISLDDYVLNTEAHPFLRSK